MRIETMVSSRDAGQSKAASSLTGTSDEFMQLLMTQLKSQDPMSPMDTNSFVSQLVQFNTLDEITQIRDLIASMAAPSSTEAQ